VAESNDLQSDARMENILGIMLRVGVVVSAAVVLVGGAIYLARHGAEQPDFHVFRGEPADLRYPADIVRLALEGDDRGLIALGLLALIATPIARVAYSVVAFARQRDFLYVGCTIIVLGVLVYGMMNG
jgi:uncharacterized membrane protein